MVYIPTSAVLTDPLAWKDPVALYVPVRVLPDPSTLSVHEAPESVYTDPWAMVRVAGQLRVVTGGVLSPTVMVRVAMVLWFPEASTFWYCWR